MEPAHEQFGQEFAARIIARDYAAAHGLLSPWLQRAMTPEGLQGIIEARLTEMMEAAECDTLTYPVGCQIDGNSSSLEFLRQPRSYAPARPIPAGVTDGNFRQWMSLQFLAGERLAIDAWFDLWMILAEDGGKLGVGYFELTDPD